VDRSLGIAPSCLPRSDSTIHQGVWAGGEESAAGFSDLGAAQ
jgi:hypothetical protein